MPQRQRIQALGGVSSKHRASSRNATGVVKYDSVIDALHQQGSARIRFPNSEPGALQAVLLNTAGGLTGDDHIQWDVSASNRSRLSVSTAACEKVYRTHGPDAVQSTNANVAQDARLDWLPQETIVFDGAALSRSLTAHIHAQATALFVESLVLGRQAMSETLSCARVRDRWRIFRDNKLLHAEDLRLDFSKASHARQQGALHHYSALSTILLVNDQSRESLQIQADAVQTLVGDASKDVTAGISVMDHRLVIRVLAIDSFRLRKFLIPCVEALNEGSPIPPVWNV